MSATDGGSQSGGNVQSNEQLVEALRACQKSIGDLRTAFIVVEGCLDKPYPDDPRWSPWTRFVQRPWNAAATASEMARAALKAADETGQSS